MCVFIFVCLFVLLGGGGLGGGFEEGERGEEVGGWILEISTVRHYSQVS